MNARRRIVRRQAKLDGLEVTFRRKDYRLTHGLISVRPVYFSGELCMLYISQDIEEVKTAQEALRQSVENYRTIIEGAPVSIAITRLSDSIYQEVNISFLPLRSLSPRGDPRPHTAGFEILHQFGGPQTVSGAFCRTGICG